MAYKIKRNKQKEKKFTKCPYCIEDIKSDDEYNEHLINKHEGEFR